METENFINIDSKNLTIWKPKKENDKKVAIVYFHGGGLIFGNRNDLPKLYTDLFLQEGFTIFSYDYPLAPEATLSEINETIFKIYCSFAEEYYKDNFKEVFLFGRSAGAYLCLVLAKRISNYNTLPTPKGIIDFYGYYDLKSTFLKEPSPYYNTFGKVQDTILESFSIKDKSADNNTKALRYSLYVYARQNGSLLDIWRTKEEDLEVYSLTEKDFDLLPPLFITASSGDKDVPMSQSKNLFRKHQKSYARWVYYLDHDFDRNINDETGKNVYIECINWINNLIKKDSNYPLEI